MSDAEAQYDCLSVVSHLAEITDGATEAEVTLFCYLACLLALFDGQPSSAWGYQFTSTRSIFLFSVELNEALSDMQRSGALDFASEQYSLTESGRAELEMLDSLTLFKSRSEWLEAACNSALAIPLPTVGTSVTYEPELRRAINLASSRILLAEAEEHPGLYEHFSDLAARVPEHAGLFVTAVTWIASLSEQARLAGPATGEGSEEAETP